MTVWTPARLYTASQWAQDVLSDILTKRGGSEMEVTTIGIDLAKNVFAVCGAESTTALALFINSDKGAASRMSLARSPPFFGDRFVNRLIR